jgi:hypothetical protein
MRLPALASMKHLPRTLLLVTVLFVAGCSTLPSTVSDRLFFGRAIPGGGEVSDVQWKAFVAEVIVPRFPEGFSIWHGSGHWKGDDGASVSEQSSVLEVVHPRDAAIDAKLDEIATAYRERFNQDAVLGVRIPVEREKFWRRPALK